MRRLLAVVLAALPCATVRVAAASHASAQADRGAAALGEVIAAETRLRDAAESERLARLDAQKGAAGALERICGVLAAALRRVAGAKGDEAVAARQAVIDAEMARAEAARALQGLLDDDRAIAVRVAEHEARIAALQSGLLALRATAPDEGRLAGPWRLVLEPGAIAGTMTLEQRGTSVSGAYALGDGRHGDVTGTFAGGRLDLARVDAAAGRDAVLIGKLAADGTLQGTWQATILGTGHPEAGAWSARPDDTAAAAADGAKPDGGSEPTVTPSVQQP